MTNERRSLKNIVLNFLLDNFRAYALYIGLNKVLLLFELYIIVQKEKVKTLLNILKNVWFFKSCRKLNFFTVRTFKL